MKLDRLCTDILDALPTPVSITTAVRDEGGRIVDLRSEYLNPAAELVTGIGRDEQIGTVLSETMPDLVGGELFRRVCDVIESGEPATVAEVRVEGLWRGERPISGLYEAELSKLGDGFVSAFREVGTARAAEERLRASEARLAEAQRIAGLGSWEWDCVADVVTWTDELYRIYGVTREEYEPSFEGYLERVHHEDRDRIAAEVRRAYAEGGVFAFDERVVRPDGSIRHLHSGGKVELDEEGRAVKMIGVCHDVTESREAEQRLADTRADLDRRRFAQRQAAEINDRIIDALVRAMHALDSGDLSDARLAMSETLEQASRIVTELSALPRPAMTARARSRSLHD